MTENILIVDPCPAVSLGGPHLPSGDVLRSGTWSRKSLAHFRGTHFASFATEKQLLDALKHLNGFLVKPPAYNDGTKCHTRFAKGGKIAQISTTLSSQHSPALGGTDSRD